MISTRLARAGALVRLISLHPQLCVVASCDPEELRDSHLE